MSAPAAPSTPSRPRVMQDPRFRAGRLLMESGKLEEAISIFATLLEDCRRRRDDDCEAAPAYYEYGNALFRAHQKAQAEEEEEEEANDDVKPAALAREAAAAAAEKRAAQPSDAPDADAAAEDKPSTSTIDEENKDEAGDNDGDGGPSDETNNDDDGEEAEGEEEDNDAQLALELMETAWSILDQSAADETTEDNPYADWVREEIPRVLTGIGDVLLSLERHADAMDAYARGLDHWEELQKQQQQQQQQQQQSDPDSADLAVLIRRRRIVEAHTLIAETLLAAPPDIDLVTSETQQVVVPAARRVDLIRGSYEKAREELQEAVLLMGKLVAESEKKKKDNDGVAKEKENICFASTMVMGVGMALAELLDGSAENEDEDNSKPPAKKPKR